MQKDHPPFKRFSKGNVGGWVEEEILNLLPDSFFEDPVLFVLQSKEEVVKESRLRFAAIFPLPGGRKIFLKRDTTKGWFEALRYLLFPTKGRKEWLIAFQLQKKNLSVPRPLGWMEKVDRGFVKESYYLSEAIGSGASLIDDPWILKESSWMDALAKAVKEIHHAGLLHKDLHAGNFLSDGQSLFVTDLHRSKIVSDLSLNQRLWNLSQLFHSLRPILNEGDHLRFIEKYFDENPYCLQKKGALLQKVYSSMDHLQRKQWKSRTKRCLRESTEFSMLKMKGGHYYHRRDFPLDRLGKVIKEHLHIVREAPPALVKQSREVLVSILNEGKDRICVKQARYPNFFAAIKEHFRRSKGLRAWVAGNGLITRGIPTLKPIALMESRSWLGLRESFFLMEASETNQEMDRFILRGFEGLKEKVFFIKAFAQWLAISHKMGVYHRDMKTCNILVSKKESGWHFYLLDLEDVVLDQRVDEMRLFKNFLQLNTSTPPIMHRTDRLRFYREYVSQNPMIMNEKVFLRRLTEKSRRRGVVYLSPQGVVVGKL
jgi:tRNA A-37 threonylcarbamoyl transferase component Bud32